MSGYAPYALLYQACVLIMANFGANRLIVANKKPNLDITSGPTLFSSRQCVNRSPEGQNHMVFVQMRDTLPEAMAGLGRARAGEAVHTAARQVAPGMAAKGIQAEQNDICHKYQRADAYTEMAHAGGVFEVKGQQGVPPENA